MPQVPIRIAYIVHTLSMGGVEHVVVMLANHLDRDRFRPMIVCLNRNKGVSCWGIAEDVPIIEVRKRPGNDVRLPFRLARIFREHRPDVVQSNNWGTLVETTLARRWARVPRHVHVEHGLELNDIRPPFLKRLARRLQMRWALQRVDLVGSVCDEVASRINGRCGFPTERITTVASGVELPPCPNKPAVRRQVRESLGIGPDALVIGSVGRLAPVKDFGNAIDAAARLFRDGEDVHLILVSDGPERGALSDRARERNIASRVHLVGHQDEIGPHLAAMDVYINCSLSEGKSISLLEAMGFGLPLVATAVGESPALVSGTDACGLVVPPADSAALAEAIGRLARDPDLRAQMGRRGQERYAAHYSVRHMVDWYQQLYLDLHQAAAGDAQTSAPCEDAA